MKTLREFSCIGPCITLGEIVAENARTWTIREYGETRRVRKTAHRAQVGLIHAEPCRSCRDHAQTQYPNGYMD